MLRGKAALKCSGGTWEQMFTYEEPLSGFRDESSALGGGGGEAALYPVRVA